MPFIYLINEDGTDNYKIGLTKSLKNRKNALQTGNSKKLTIVKKYETNYPRRLEAMLHMYHFAKRGNGEWFVLENEDVFGFIALCEKYSNTINYLKEHNEFFQKKCY